MAFRKKWKGEKEIMTDFSGNHMNTGVI
jgi:hypothetical protein